MREQPGANNILILGSAFAALMIGGATIAAAPTAPHVAPTPAPPSLSLPESLAEEAAPAADAKAPLSEAFGRWNNLKFVLICLFGAVAGQAVV